MKDDAEWRQAGAAMIDERVDRSRLTVTSFDEAEAGDIDYWMSRSPTERVEAGEYLRRWVYGDAPIDAGLQRVLATAELGAD